MQEDLLHFAYWSPYSQGGARPRLLPAKASRADWSYDPARHDVRRPPTRFLGVDQAQFGPVIYPSGYALLRDDLLAALHALVADALDCRRVRIRPPGTGPCIERYSIVTTRRSLPEHALQAESDERVIATVEGEGSYLVVSDALRVALRGYAVAGLEFYHPVHDRLINTLL